MVFGLTLLQTLQIAKFVLLQPLLEGQRRDGVVFSVGHEVASGVAHGVALTGLLVVVHLIERSR